MVTPQQAEQYAKRVFRQHYRGTEAYVMIRHCELIIECATLISEGKHINLRPLTTAAWLHDIGRTVDPETHPQKSLEMATAHFGTLDPIVQDCILHHGYDAKATTSEGRIMQLADKLSLLTPEVFIPMAREKSGAYAILKQEKNLKKLAVLLQHYHI